MDAQFRGSDNFQVRTEFTLLPRKREASSPTCDPFVTTLTRSCSLDDFVDDFV